MMKQMNVVIIGIGIVGLALAKELMYRYPASKMTVPEKKLRLHSSGINSGALLVASIIHLTP